MVLESHVEIKRIPAVPEADANESAATCRPKSRFPKEWCPYNTETFTPSPPSSCIRRTKYRLESLTVSTAMPGYSFTGACANSSPAGQEGKWQLQTTQSFIQLILFRVVTDNSGVPWLIFTWHFVLQFDKRHFAPSCDPHATRPVRSIQFPVSCPGLHIDDDDNARLHSIIHQFDE